MLVVLVVLVLIVVVIALVVEESVWRLRSAPSLADSPLMSSSAAAAAASAMGLVRGQLLVVPLVLVCASTLAGNIRIFIH